MMKLNLPVTRLLPGSTIAINAVSNTSIKRMAKSFPTALLKGYGRSGILNP